MEHVRFTEGFCLFFPFAARGALFFDEGLYLRGQAAGIFMSPPKITAFWSKTNIAENMDFRRAVKALRRFFNSRDFEKFTHFRANLRRLTGDWHKLRHKPANFVQ